jgi:hypothetical protein
MCTQLTAQAIETVVGEMAQQRLSFTGQDVHARIHNTHIKRAQDFSVCAESPKEISNEVRKMFNGSAQCFRGYGSTIVEGGPVLYFALPHHALHAAKKIMLSMARNAPQD